MAEAAPTYQEVLDGLSRVAEANGDCFRLKVVRRPSAASSLTQHVATFCDATWSMIANAESWLAPFCGGGLYVIQIFDGKDGRKQYGSIVPSEIPGQPRPPDARVTKASGWIGPSLIEAVTGNGAGAVAYGMQHIDPSQVGAPGPYNSTPAPRTLDEAGLRSLFSSQTEDLRRREREIEEKAHRVELEGVRRAADEQAKRLEAQLNDLKAIVAKPALPPPPPPPGPDVGQIVSGILAAAAPIITVFWQTSSAEKAARAAAEEARHRAEAEDRRARAIAEAEDRRAASVRPLVPPEILALLQTGAERGEKQAAEFGSLMKAQAESARINMESQAVAQRTMLQTIADIAQLQLKTGEGEAPGIDWGKVVGGALQALTMMKGQMGAQPGQPPAGQPISTPQLAGAVNGATPNGAAAPPPPDVPESPILDKLEDRIRAKGSPPEIVDDLKKALSDAGVQAEIAGTEGGLEGVFSERLSDFAEDKANEIYMGSLVAALEKAGLSVGG
jgi:hypothetical protein